SPEWRGGRPSRPEAPRVDPPPEGLRLPPWGELSSEVLAPVGSRQILVEALERRQSVPLSLPDAEIRRVEAGRPSFGLEATPGVLPQEAGLSDAVAGNK